MFGAGNGFLCHEMHFAAAVYNPISSVIHSAYIEDIVQQHGEHLSIVHNVVGEFFLLLGLQGTVRQGQQLGEAHNGVKRGSYLVTHVLDEAGLGRIGQPYFFVGLLQLLDVLLIYLLALFQVVKVG